MFIDSRSSVLDTQTNPMVFGSMPNDGGNLIIEENEYASFLQQEPEAERYIRPFLGAEEFINNKKRYCLWLLNAEPQHLKNRGRMFRKSKRQRLCKRRKRYWMRARSFPIAPLPTYMIPILCLRYSPKRTPPLIPLWISCIVKQPSPTMPPVWLFCSSCMGRRRRGR